MPRAPFYHEFKGAFLVRMAIVNRMHQLVLYR